jgi:hypothetical protein
VGALSPSSREVDYPSTSALIRLNIVEKMNEKDYSGKCMWIIFGRL